MTISLRPLNFTLRLIGAAPLFAVALASFGFAPRALAFEFGPQSCRLLFADADSAVTKEFRSSAKAKGITVLSEDGQTIYPFNDFYFSVQASSEAQPIVSRYEIGAYTTQKNRMPIWRGSAQQVQLTLQTLSCESLNQGAIEAYQRLAIAPRFAQRLARGRISDRIAPGMSEMILSHEAVTTSAWWNMPSTAKKLNDEYRIILREAQAAYDQSQGLTFFDRLDAIRRVLVSKVSMYCPRQAREDGFFLKDCGNCEAQTLLFTSILLDMKLSWEPGYYLAVQVFRDHVRPVLFARDQAGSGEKVIIDLVYGTFERGLSGDLFSPEILSYAYLNFRGAAGSFDREKLSYGGTDLTKINWALGFQAFFGQQKTPTLAQGGSNTYLEFGPSLSSFGRADAVAEPGTIVFTELGATTGQGSGETGESGDVMIESQSVGGEAFQKWAVANGLKDFEASAGPQGQGRPLPAGPSGGTAPVKTELKMAEHPADMPFEMSQNELVPGDYIGGDAYLRKPNFRQAEANEQIPFLEGLDFYLIAKKNPGKPMEEQRSGATTIYVINPGFDIVFRYGSKLANEWQSFSGENQYHALKDQIDARLYQLMNTTSFDRVNNIYGNFLLAGEVFENERIVLAQFQKDIKELWRTGEIVMVGLYRRLFFLENRTEYFEKMAKEPKVPQRFLSLTMGYYAFRGFSHVAIDMLRETYQAHFRTYQKEKTAADTIFNWNESQRNRFFRFFVSSMYDHPYGYIADFGPYAKHVIDFAVSSEDRARMRAPLLPLFEQFVMNSEYSVDPKTYQSIRREQVIMVEVERGGKWQPMPKREPEIGLQKTEQTKTEDDDADRSRPSLAAKLMTRDLFLGLSLSQRPLTLQMPLVQMRLFASWDEEMQKAYRDQFGDLKAAGISMLQAWSWSPVLTSNTVEAWHRQAPLETFLQADQMGLQFFDQYAELKAGGQAKQLLLTWTHDPDALERFPDSHQALPGFMIEDLLAQIKINQPSVEARTTTFVDRSDAERILPDVLSMRKSKEMTDRAFYLENYRVVEVDLFVNGYLRDSSADSPKKGFVSSVRTYERWDKLDLRYVVYNNGELGIQHSDLDGRNDLSKIEAR